MNTKAHLSALVVFHKFHHTLQEGLMVKQLYGVSLYSFHVHVPGKGKDELFIEFNIVILSDLFSLFLETYSFFQFVIHKFSEDV